VERLTFFGCGDHYEYHENMSQRATSC